MLHSLSKINHALLNNLFSCLANTPNMVTWICCPKFIRQIYLSESFKSVFGWTRDAMYEDMTLWRRFLIPTDREEAINNLFVPVP